MAITLLQKFLLNLGSGLSLFSSVIVGAVAMLLFLEPGTANIFAKIVLTIGVVAIKTILFYQLMKSLSLTQVNPKLVVVYIVDVIGLLILFFSNISVVMSISILTIWILAALVLALLGLPRGR